MEASTGLTPLLLWERMSNPLRYFRLLGFYMAVAVTANKLPLLKAILIWYDVPADIEAPVNVELSLYVPPPPFTVLVAGKVPVYCTPFTTTVAPLTESDCAPELDRVTLRLTFAWNSVGVPCTLIAADSEYVPKRPKTYDATPTPTATVTASRMIVASTGDIPFLFVRY